MLEQILDQSQRFAGTFASLAWGPWLIALLLGGGLFFLIYSRLLPFRHLGHAYGLLRGRYDDAGAPGHVSHFSALSAALAGTIGMGNIAGVALAIHAFGPGTIFWMWMTAIVGIATKFFTCTLSVMYRGKDREGALQGGPMYVIREALPARFMPLAYLFAIAGLIGALPAFQSNQLVQVMREVIFIDAPLSPFEFNFIAGATLALLTGGIMLGGIRRVARVAALLVPAMTLLYLGAALVCIASNIIQLPGMFKLIVADAFTGEAAAGGALLSVILYGVQRGAYSNEAGIGTESMAHGAARTHEPVREGLVAMVGPIVDTLLICSATAFVILISGTWQSSDSNGVTLTAQAFTQLLGPAGTFIISACVICFATTTMFTYSFYGTQCANFLFPPGQAHYYRYLYLAFILISAIVSLETAIGIIDGAFALMAIPTMTSTLILAPRVMKAARIYLSAHTAS